MAGVAQVTVFWDLTPRVIVCSDVSGELSAFIFTRTKLDSDTLKEKFRQLFYYIYIKHLF
jgi:hypothetical protein